MRLLDRVLGDFPWYRRAVGGHWERWHVDEDTLAGDQFGTPPQWFHLPGCSRLAAWLRPPGVCGEPQCEDATDTRAITHGPATAR